MRAMVLRQPGPITESSKPLELVDYPIPDISPKELRIKVAVCGVCHTELDEIEGRLAPARLPAILGHQIVGTVDQIGSEATGFRRGDRVGVAWIHSSCGECEACLSDCENLCPQFRATGRDVPGGYAEFLTAPAAFAFPLSSDLADTQIAPMLCAGAIGYRSLRLTNLVDGQRLGLVGFGASAHLVLKMIQARLPRSEVLVFARSESERQFARQLGAVWAGDFEETPPVPLHAAIDTTPAWRPVVATLRHLRPGRRLVINAIRKEQADQSAWQFLDYPRDLWMEKEIKSVANVTRRDVAEFLELAAECGLRPEVKEYPLEEANRALIELKFGPVRGAKVLRVA